MFSLILYSTVLIAPVPAVPDVASKQAQASIRCETRELIQGSGTVRICERAR